MFDIGFWEVSLIAIVALLVVGPDRLPSMTRTAGQLIGRAKRTVRELKYDLEREAEFEELNRLKNDYSKNSVNELNSTLNEAISIDNPKPVEIEDKARDSQ